jgi:hypothetical protein
LPFLSGLCTFGALCRNDHPSDADCAALLAEFASKPCHFGEECRTAGCLYWHPWAAGGAEGDDGGYYEEERYEGGGYEEEGFKGGAAAAGGAGGGSAELHTLPPQAVAVPASSSSAALKPEALEPSARLSCFYEEVDTAMLPKVSHHTAKGVGEGGPVMA